MASRGNHNGRDNTFSGREQPLPTNIQSSHQQAVNPNASQPDPTSPISNQQNRTPPPSYEQIRPPPPPYQQNPPSRENTVGLVRRRLQEQYDVARYLVDDHGDCLERTIEFGYPRPHMEPHQVYFINKFQDTHDDYIAIEQRFDEIEAQSALNEREDYELARAIVDDHAAALRNTLEFGFRRSHLNRVQIVQFVNRFQDTYEDYIAIEQQYNQIGVHRIQQEREDYELARAIVDRHGLALRNTRELGHQRPHLNEAQIVHFINRFQDTYDDYIAIEQQYDQLEVISLQMEREKYEFARSIVDEHQLALSQTVESGAQRPHLSPAFLHFVNKYLDTYNDHTAIEQQFDQFEAQLVQSASSLTSCATSGGPLSGNSATGCNPNG